MDGKRKVLVIDTSAFISGFDPSAVNEEAYSVSRVGDELLEGSIMKMRFNASIESGRLKLINPSVKCIDIAKEASREVGDIGSLSEADIEVLALAVQLKDRGYEAVVLTDDYSMQNVAEKLELNFTPLANLGIRYHLSWIYYCPACGRKYPPDRPKNNFMRKLWNAAEKKTRKKAAGEKTRSLFSCARRKRRNQET
ncbi:MAG: hypothetical protein QXR06_03940 [Candidatus Bathyarchaeia archaeon]